MYKKKKSVSSRDFREPNDTIPHGRLVTVVKGSSLSVGSKLLPKFIKKRYKQKSLMWRVLNPSGSISN